jgi:NAD+-dependent secondary alcohol dehydrogenase Adh1
MNTPLPYILGHENAGWVHEVGEAVTNVQPGDTVILHPTPTCGLCHACRAGDDMHCENSTFPGLSTDGGMAEYLKTSARACVKLDPTTKPKDVAALADAGITAYHAVRKALPLLTSASSAWPRCPRPTSSWSTATRTRSSSPGSSAPSTPWSPMATRSTPSRT